MAKGNAENLNTILEFARARRLNGLMNLEHVQGGKIEEGEVFFQTGQPIQARVGHLVGQDALNWLLKWNNIAFTIGKDEPIQSNAANNQNNPTSSSFSTTPHVPQNAYPS